MKTGDKAENAVFTRIDRLASTALHAEGWYPAAGPMGRTVGLALIRWGAVTLGLRPRLV